MDSIEWTVYFVTTTLPNSHSLRSVSKTAPTNKPSLLTLAYQCCCDFSNMRATLMSGAQVKSTFTKKPPPRRAYFVLEDFEGDMFQHLEKIEAILFGPQVILDYIRDGKPLVRWPMPLFSTALKSVTVSLTSIQGVERDVVFRRIQMLHGIALKDLTDEVDVLIAPATGSQKYYTAGSLGIPIVRPSWLDEIWQLSKEVELVDGMDAALLERHRLPIFQDMVIVVSGFEPTDRDEVKRLVELHGGCYSPHLKAGECTHLLLCEPYGEKYEFAVKWKLPTVHLRWLIQSIEKGYALEEKDFQVTKDTFSSGPLQQKQNKLALLNVKKEISKPNFFKDIRIALLGFPGGEVKRLMSEIRRAGGQACCTVIDMVALEVTHIVLKKNSSQIPKDLPFLDDEDEIKKTSSGHTVSQDQAVYVWSTWLDACLETQKVVDINPHLARSLETQAKRKAACSSVNKESESSLSSKESKEHPKAMVVDEQELTLIQQYFNSVEAYEDDGNGKSGNSWCVSATPRVRLIKEENFYFHSKLAVEDKTQLQELLRSVSGSGTSLISAPSRATVAVLPNLYHTREDENILHLPKHCVKVTSAFIFQCCLEWRQQASMEAVLHVDRLSEDYLYRPFEFGNEKPQGSRSPHLPLEGCVLSLTGFGGSRRNHLVRCCIYAGACVQEFFSRIADPRKGVKPSTHLICIAPEGKKYEASVQWRIPAVKESWISASLTLGSRAAEADHGFCSVTSTVTPKPLTPPSTPVTLPQSATNALSSGLQAKEVSSEVKVTVQKPAVSSLPVQETIPIAPLPDEKVSVKSPVKVKPSLQRHATIDVPIPVVTDVTATSSSSMYSFLKDEKIIDATLATTVPLHLSISSSSFKGVQRPLRRRYNSDQNSEEFVDVSSLNPGGTISSEANRCGENQPMNSCKSGTGQGEFNNRSLLSYRNEVTALPPKEILTGDAKLTQDHPDVRWLYSDRNETPSFPTEVSSHEKISTTHQEVKSTHSKTASGFADASHKSSNAVSLSRQRTENNASSKSSTITKPSAPTATTSIQSTTSKSTVDYPQNPSTVPLNRLGDVSKVRSPPQAFMFSGLTDPEKQMCENVIRQLGSVSLDAMEHFSRVSHLIIKVPSRSEKLITGLSKGIWILHLSYMEACQQANKWVDETPFEWGHPNLDKELIKYAESNNRLDLSNLRTLAAASTLWREKGGSAFRNWKVIFSPKSAKEVSFRRLIEIGGGKILATEPPYPPPSSVTHAFVDQRITLVGLRASLPAGFIWLSFEYIGEYLTKPKDVDLQKYVIQVKRAADGAAVNQGNAAKRARA